jgi:hypothetical protein
MFSTTALLKHWLDYQPLPSRYCYDCDKDLNDGRANDFDCSAYAVDRIIGSWHTFSLSVKDWKTVDYASMPLTDAAMFDVDRSVGALKTLIDISQVAYRLGNQALVNAALASLRSQCLDDRFSVDEWINAVSDVYAIVIDVERTFTVGDDSVRALKGILLAASIQHVDALLSSEEDSFEEALQASEFLRDDWSRTLRWHY